MRDLTKYYSPEPNSGCWLWTKALSRDDGYGKVFLNYRGYLAHRFFYELHKGPIPEGLVIDHLCRIRSCVNPDHMQPVTNKENILRGVGLAAQNKKKTHCPKGHEYTEENTCVSLSGKRSCRSCGRLRWTERSSREI